MGISSERILSMLGLLVLSGMAVAVAFLKPGTTALLPPCPFHALTGFFCPGCGSTRMFYYLVHGEYGRALRQNPLAFAALPFVVAALINDSLPAAYRVHFEAGQAFFRSRAWPITILVVVIVFTVLRNIPVWPLSWLVPDGG